jgi:putative membrane protein
MVWRLGNSMMGEFADKKSEAVAIDITSLALDRTVLANERTFTAWIRTGLASLVTGLGIARFMLGAMPLWSVQLISVLLISFSSGAFLIAAWRFESLHVGMVHMNVKTIPLILVKALSLLLAGCSLLALSGIVYMTY